MWRPRRKLFMNLMLPWMKLRLLSKLLLISNLISGTEPALFWMRSRQRILPNGIKNKMPKKLKWLKQKKKGKMRPYGQKMRQQHILLRRLGQMNRIKRMNGKISEYPNGMKKLKDCRI